MMHDSMVRRGSLATRMREPREHFAGACVDVTRSSGEPSLPTPRATPLQSSPGFWRFWHLTAPRASVVGLNGLLGRVHNRHAVHPARPAWPVREGPGQAGAEW